MPTANIKQTFVEALRATPDGITDFLTTPLPAAPSIAAPADVDAAIIANGIAAKFVLDLFQPFAGLTPIELLLRIGQHNSVLEAGLLAGLQYIGDSEAQQNFEILAPEEGIAYSPGEVRFEAQALNGTLTSIDLTIGAQTYALKSVEDVWRQYLNLDIGDYAATFAATFKGQDTPQTIAVNFSIAAYDENDPPAEQPEPPGGKDKSALDAAFEKLKSAVGNAVGTLNWTDILTFDIPLDILDRIRNAFTDLCNIAIHLKGDAATITQAKTDFDTTWTNLETAISNLRPSDIELYLADIINLASTVYASVQ
jgi:hypothetical protein